MRLIGKANGGGARGHVNQIAPGKIQTSDSSSNSVFILKKLRGKIPPTIR